MFAARRRPPSRNRGPGRRPAASVPEIARAISSRRSAGFRLTSWTTSEGDRFAEDRLHPVVHTLLSEIFGDQLPPEPERVTMQIVDVWMGR
jgi:hypothetical protein